jgi:hypothetical protein
VGVGVEKVSDFAGSRVARSVSLALASEWVADHLAAWHNRDHDD